MEKAVWPLYKFQSLLEILVTVCPGEDAFCDGESHKAQGSIASNFVLAAEILPKSALKT